MSAFDCFQAQQQSHPLICPFIIDNINLFIESTARLQMDRCYSWMVRKYSSNGKRPFILDGVSFALNYTQLTHQISAHWKWEDRYSARLQQIRWQTGQTLVGQRCKASRPCHRQEQVADTRFPFPTVWF